MKSLDPWLGDTSSLWLSLGALIVIALLCVLMFNAFPGTGPQGAIVVQGFGQGESDR